ncbi:serine/threonine protein kinase [Streptosporangium subroseum]|uniref:serine/threonine protein kinase n=1 Tax=Streptosporangium subroseum TaxID=106412 RepID=UPI00344931F6
MGDLHPLLPEDPERIGVHLLVGRLLEDPAQAVYLGHLPDEDTLRVIRVLEPRPDADPQARERITNELHAAGRVSGAHTARLLEVGWSDDSPYVVREHVEGRSLREAVTVDGPLSGDALERLAVSVLTALTAVHLSGLVHGGLTPDTVLLGSDGPLVCDIGLGGVDPGYRAPEHLRTALMPGGDAARIPDADPGQAPVPDIGPGQEPVPVTMAGRPADLFAWASTIVYAATGRPPFTEWPETAPEGPADLSSIPPGLRSLVIACLDGDPEARPDTRAAMLRLLGEQPAGSLLPFPPVLAEDGMNVPGVDVSGMNMPGTNVSGMDVPGMDVPGVNVSDADVPSVNASAMDVPGVNVPGVEAGPQDGALYPAAVLPPTPPVWGAPPIPGSPPPMSGTVISDPVREQRSTPGFPLMLVAGVGVVALLSGLGIWAAGNYTSLGNAGQVAAGEKVPLTLSSQWQGQGSEGPGQGPTEDPANRVTVPWGMTPEPQVGDVGPLQLSTDVPTLPSLNPLTSPPVSSPAMMPTLPPVPVPTAVPTTAPRATGKAKTTPTSKAARTSKPPAAKPTPPATRPPAAKPTTAAPKPTTAPPSAKPTTKPPSANPTTKPPAAKPTPTKTTAPPAAKPTTAAPKPPAAVQRSNPYSPQQACGAGFSVQRQASFSGGTVYQLYNASTGNNCAVAMKSADVGKATQVWATLEVQGGGTSTDRGNFDYYAGPVILSGKGKCVRISGGGPGGSASTNWANCG